MEMLSGAEMVVRSLIDQGVKQVFGYPGGAVLDIYDALHTVGGIDHVLVRHEQAAVHMADGQLRSQACLLVIPDDEIILTQNVLSLLQKYCSH